jgi:hypothetical protein
LAGRALIGLAFVALLINVACSSDEASTIADSGPVLSVIPWTVPETASYTLTRDDDEIGAAELRIEPGDAGSNRFSQDFAFPDRDITDEVEVNANTDTLSPNTVKRLVNSPDGERSWDAQYGSSEVTVAQRAGEGERTDTIDVPKTSYDTWTDLFLWRTIDFREGYEVKYSAVVTAEFTKPDVISIVLAVKGKETVTVPAGTFETWRLEIRSGGRTQKAWIEDSAERTLVRYDNTELVFELDS